MKSLAIKKARLELIPLTDLVFLLLTFFMFAIVQMRLDNGIMVDLPEVQGSSPSDSRHSTVTITEEGRIFFNGQKTGMNELYPKIVSLGTLVKSKTHVVTINGDKEAPHGLTVAVLNILQKAKVNQVFFSVNGTDSGTKGYWRW